MSKKNKSKKHISWKPSASHLWVHTIDGKAWGTRGCGVSTEGMYKSIDKMNRLQKHREYLAGLRK